MQVMRDKDGGLAEIADETGKFLLQIHPRYHVERSERFVEQDYRRIGRKRTRDADALALAAGEFVREAVGEARRFQADEFEHFGTAVADLLFVAIKKFEHKPHIVTDGHMREQAAFLQDVANVPSKLDGVPVGRPFSFDQNFAARRVDQAVYQF